MLIEWGVVNQDPLYVGNFPCREDLRLGFLRFQGVFSIWGRYGRVEDPIVEHFPSAAMTGLRDCDNECMDRTVGLEVVQLDKWREDYLGQMDNNISCQTKMP